MNVNVADMRKRVVYGVMKRIAFLFAARHNRQACERCEHRARMLNERTLHLAIVAMNVQHSGAKGIASASTAGYFLALF